MLRLLDLRGDALVAEILDRDLAAAVAVLLVTVAIDFRLLKRRGLNRDDIFVSCTELGVGLSTVLTLLADVTGVSFRPEGGMGGREDVKGAETRRFDGVFSRATGVVFFAEGRSF